VTRGHPESPGGDPALPLDDESVELTLSLEAGSFTEAGWLTYPRDGHTATAQLDGRVLVVGGEVSDGHRLATAEVWDPATASFGPAGHLAEAREKHTATLLSDGRVLLISGSSATVWEPSGGLAFSQESPSPTARRGQPTT
jgi:hypothetical protein